MSIKVVCCICKKELDKPGALLFSPPYHDNLNVVDDKKDRCQKFHICKECYENNIIDLVLIDKMNTKEEEKRIDSLIEKIDSDSIELCNVCYKKYKPDKVRKLHTLTVCEYCLKDILNEK